MAERISETAYGDAPLSAAYHPNARAVDPQADDDEALVGRTVTIKRPIAELYAFWRDPQSLMQVMPDVSSVQAIDSARIRWVISSEDGDRTMEWAIVEDVPNRCIAWRTTDDEAGPRGRIEFREAPADRGTEVTITLTHPHPNFFIRALHALKQDDPKIQARRTLRRFKQLMETGEVATAAPPHAAPRG